jgi:putative endonuclease
MKSTSLIPSSRTVGAHIELLVQQHLERCGLRFLIANYQRRMGEIDLVFEDEVGCIVFVEVRYRKHVHYGGGSASVDTHKARKLRRTALAFLQQYSLTQRSARIDVVAVSPKHNNFTPATIASDTIHLPSLNELDIDWIKNAVEN